MIKKLKDNCGSAMQIAIISILLIGIFTSVVTSMVINQTKSNIKNSQNIGLKYGAEEGIDETIAEYIDRINLVGDKSALSNFNMIQQYIELANILVQSNGSMNTTINSALEKISSGTIKYSDIVELCKDLGEIKGGSNGSARALLTIAEDYAIFFRDNLFNKTTGEIDIINTKEDVVKPLILKITDNLTNKSFVTGSGTLGSVYEEVNLNNSQYISTKYLDNIHNIFFKNNTINDKYITDKINSLENLNNLNQTNIKDIVKKINDTNYKDNINSEISNVKIDGYIDTDALKQKYNNSTTGNIKPVMKYEVAKRLEIVGSEIEMLKQCLIHLLDLNGGVNDSDSSDLDYKLIVIAPKEISVPGSITRIKTAEVTPDYEYSKHISYIDDTLKFNVKTPEPSAKIHLNLKVESQVQDETKGNYKIESNVNVRIHKILSKDNYKVDYEVKDWNKVNTP